MIYWHLNIRSFIVVYIHKIRNRNPLRVPHSQEREPELEFLRTSTQKEVQSSAEYELICNPLSKTRDIFFLEFLNFIRKTHKETCVLIKLPPIIEASSILEALPF
jgi:hypothetical protein